jgi:hypothetical protein
MVARFTLGFLAAFIIAADYFVASGVLWHAVLHAIGR